MVLVRTLSQVSRHDCTLVAGQISLDRIALLGLSACIMVQHEVKGNMS